MNFMRNHTALLALLPIAAILTIQPAFAADIDEKAQTVLESFSKLIEGVDSLKVNVSVATTIEIQDKSNEINAKHIFAFQRPNLFALRIQEGALGGATVNDGRNLYTYVPGLRSYTESDAPGSYAEFLERGEFGMLRMAAGNTPVLDAMMYASPFDAIRDGVETMTYHGTEDVGGVSCHVVEIAGKGPTWKCWIDAGEKPWILKAAPDMTEFLLNMGLPQELIEDAKTESTVLFTNWEANPALPGNAFAFTPPDGARKVNSFEEAMAQLAPETPELGKTAPDFTLTGLDGEETTLSAFRGEKIVVLDFWATWCPPCQKGLPILDEVAGDYEGKDVVFYAVNQGETPDKVKAFIQETNLGLPVALDERVRIGRLYQVRGIPQTFIIGKDGIIQDHHQGLPSDLEERLRHALDTLLEGGSLVGGG